MVLLFFCLIYLSLINLVAFRVLTVEFYFTVKDVKGCSLKPFTEILFPKPSVTTLPTMKTQK